MIIYYLVRYLHEEGRVLVVLLGKRVELGDRLVEGRLRQTRGAFGHVHYLVVEYREVQCETQSNGVGRLQFGHCEFTGRFVCEQRTLCGLFALGARRELADVALVVRFPVGIVFYIVY